MGSDSPTVQSGVFIQGSGIVAHVCALLLSQQGHRVALSPAREASAVSGHGDVRAYALNQRSVDVLSAIKVWQSMPAAAVCPVRGMQIHADGQAPVHLNPLAGQSDMAWIVDVPALEATLRQALAFAPNLTQLSADQTGLADLTVVCEGRTSAMRTQLGVNFDVDRYPHTAIAARLHCERPHEGIARQWFGQPGRGDILALLPLGGEGNSVALVWSTDHDRAQTLQAMSAEDFEQRLMAACQHALGPMRLGSERLGWTLQRATAQRLVGAGWALVGDAAHNVHPLAGQGLNLGLADSDELARTLSQKESFRSLGDIRLLRRYERARQLDILAMGAVTDGIFRCFAHTDARVQTLRQWGMACVQKSPLLQNFLVRRAMGTSS